MFENVINEEAIEALDEETLDSLIAMLEKAGY
jgi:BRCT domain type II-containing protein